MTISTIFHAALSRNFCLLSSVFCLLSSVFCLYDFCLYGFCHCLCCQAYRNISGRGPDRLSPTCEVYHNLARLFIYIESLITSPDPFGISVTGLRLGVTASLAPALTLCLSVRVCRQVISSSTGAIIAVANPALTLSAVTQPLSLVTHTKLERVKSELSASRVKSEPAAATGRPNGRSRLGD